MNYNRISKNDFNHQVLKQNETVCVAFGSNWTGTLYLVQPALTDIVNKTNGRIKLVVLDYDSNIWFAEQNNIHFHAPSILIFQKGVKTNHAVGIIACLDLLFELHKDDKNNQIKVPNLETK